MPSSSPWSSPCRSSWPCSSAGAAVRGVLVLRRPAPAAAAKTADPGVSHLELQVIERKVAAVLPPEKVRARVLVTPEPSPGGSRACPLRRESGHATLAASSVPACPLPHNSPRRTRSTRYANHPPDRPRQLLSATTAAPAGSGSKVCASDRCGAASKVCASLGSDLDESRRRPPA